MVEDLLEEGGQERLEAEIPDEWIDRLTVMGAPEDCQLAIRRLVNAGADTRDLGPLAWQELGRVGGVRSFSSLVG
jgi:hypothetical protein